jgi:hypothetical protein
MAKKAEEDAVAVTVRLAPAVYKDLADRVRIEERTQNAVVSRAIRLYAAAAERSIAIDEDFLANLKASAERTECTCTPPSKSAHFNGCPRIPVILAIIALEQFLPREDRNLQGLVIKKGVR